MTPPTSPRSQSILLLLLLLMLDATYYIVLWPHLQVESGSSPGAAAAAAIIPYPSSGPIDPARPSPAGELAIESKWAISRCGCAAGPARPDCGVLTRLSSRAGRGG